MQAMMRNAVALAALLTVLFTNPALAQQSVAFGDYEVHYSSMNTSMLSPDVASAYGIQRADTQAMLNITVLDRQSDAPLAAAITASATNLTGQRRDIELRRINDQGAIYYIGQFRIHNEETLNFRIEVVPEGHDGAPLELAFRQQYFTG
ncbi:MAG: DUF4426 domain-containing protein [Wenzhouxiangellaceae bacterium]|nr:DUF4426 domain-containing protein [Wenzhouxiangellaceae bacterium]